MPTRIRNPRPVHQPAGHFGSKTSRQGTVALGIAHVLSPVTRYEETRDGALAWCIAGIHRIDSPAGLERRRSDGHELPRSVVVEVMQHPGAQHDVERLERGNLSLLQQPAVKKAPTAAPLPPTVN